MNPPATASPCSDVGRHSGIHNQAVVQGPHNAASQWQQASDAAGTYFLNKRFNLVLGIAKASKAAGAQAVAFDNRGKPAQRWILESQADGTTKL